MIQQAVLNLGFIAPHAVAGKSIADFVSGLISAQLPTGEGIKNENYDSGQFWVC
jgi:hypothetical protein